MDKKKKQFWLSAAAIALAVLFVLGYLFISFFDEAAPGFQTEQTTHIDIPFRADGTVDGMVARQLPLGGSTTRTGTDVSRFAGSRPRNAVRIPRRSSAGFLDEKHADGTRHPLHRGKRHDRKYRGKCPAVRRNFPSLAGSGAVRTGDSRRDVRCTRHPGGRFGKLDTGLISFRP